jgi:tRNA A37 threonylcarbamoyladenosine dehydratase
MGTMYDRTSWLIGEEAMEKLKISRVIVFGLGGVGGICTEALARAGVGSIDLVDFDRVDITNLNRQVIAFHSTLGKPKTEAMAACIRDINPEARIREYGLRVTWENVGELIQPDVDYVVDAIDDVQGKLAIITRARELNLPVISSMGTGNKLQGEKFTISPIEKTHTCPLAKRIRKELKERDIRGIKVVYSPEEPFRAIEATEETRSPASISFIPPIAGLLLAGEIVRDLTKMERNDMR